MAVDAKCSLRGGKKGTAAVFLKEVNVKVLPEAPTPLSAVIMEENLS